VPSSSECEPRFESGLEQDSYHSTGGDTAWPLLVHWISAHTGMSEASYGRRVCINDLLGLTRADTARVRHPARGGSSRRSSRRPKQATRERNPGAAWLKLAERAELPRAAWSLARFVSRITGSRGDGGMAADRRGGPSRRAETTIVETRFASEHERQN